MWHPQSDKILISSDVRFTPLVTPPTTTNQTEVPGLLDPLDRFTPVSAMALSAGASDIVSAPSSLSHALASPEHKLWRNSMERELSDLERRQTWTLIPKQQVPPSAKIASGKWVFTVKQRPKDPTADSDGLLRKSRWVIFGNQLESSTREEKYAPVLTPVTTRLLFAVGAQLEWTNREADAIVAYLHGRLQSPVYMYPPHGFSQRYHHQIRKVAGSLYGLESSAKIWHDHLSSKLRSLGLSQSAFDPGL